MVARRFYDKGEISLEVACQDIDQWPLPIPGNTLDLPLMGHLFQVCSFPLFEYYLPVSKASRKVANLTERKICIPLYVVSKKISVCLLQTLTPIITTQISTIGRGYKICHTNFTST